MLYETKQDIDSRSSADFFKENLAWNLIREAPLTKVVEFANSIDPDEAPHNETSHMYRHYFTLQSNSLDYWIC